MLAGAALFAVTSAAAAQRKGHEDEDATFAPAPATRRSDFTLGAVAGAWLGSASGYPNEVVKIDNPIYKSSTGLGVGGGGSAWIGGALRDWFVFGVGATGGSFDGKGVHASGAGMIFRIEAFPLFALGGALQDLGLSSSFGITSYSLSKDGEKTASGGAMSHIAFGAFYEALRLGKFALGPTLEYTHTFSQTLTMDTVLGGVRLAIYGGPK
jgi:hypothetical protein